jgi:hypothetical protein
VLCFALLPPCFPARKAVYRIMLFRFALLALLAGPCLAQDTARKEITLDAKTLSRYVGTYRMASGANMFITLDNNQLLSKLGNQQAIPIFPESKTMFFPKVVNAELEFTKDDDQGRPTELILHQGGRDMPAKRLDDAEAKKVADAAAAFAKRFKDQTAAPGSEASLRKMVEDLAQGKPNYDMMSPGLAEATRNQLPQMQPMIAQLGALQSVTFKSVGPGGADVYSVKFEKGALEYRIWLSPDGKVDSANFHPE